MKCPAHLLDLGQVREHQQDDGRLGGHCAGGVVPSGAGVEEVGVQVAAAAVDGDRRVGAAEQLLGHRTAPRSEPEDAHPVGSWVHGVILGRRDNGSDA